MPLFNFLKSFFGWVDEGSRKRRANSSSSDKEFVTPKKHRYNFETASNKECIQIDDDFENDKIEVIEPMFSPITPCGKLNGGHYKRGQLHGCDRISPQSSTSKPSVLRANHTKVHTDYFGSMHDDPPVTCISETCPTLTKTHRLRERNQYGELLQNFLPHRIHVLHSKHNQARSNDDTPEVIILDKSELSEEPCKDKNMEKKQQTQRNAKVSNLASLFHAQRAAGTVQQKNKKGNEESSPNEYSKWNTIDYLRNKTQTEENNVTTFQAIATNTLRDRLATMAVVKGNYVPQISKRYDERIEQRCKEAEELKRMTCLLSKRNRLTREAVLEEQLARSMRLCAVILDEREESEDVQLPTLTSSMLREVKDALVPRPPDEVLVEGFGLRITRKDIHTLCDLNWLNDEVINFYMNLLIVRGSSNNNKYPKVHAMNTFFYPKLITGGHSSLKRWTRKIDIFSQDLIVIPVHLGIHWCMSIIDFRNKSIHYYDSMGSSNNKCLTALRQYLQDESLDKKKKPYDTSDWKLECANNIPQQMNGSDCGVFSCMFAEYRCANRKINFTQDDMPYFRYKMVYEILKSKLL